VVVVVVVLVVVAASKQFLFVDICAESNSYVLVIKQPKVIFIFT
jgi:hypothetical protein